MADVVLTLDSTQLERATPCGDYDVRGLVNHFAGTTAWLERMGRRTAADADDPFGAKQDVTPRDWQRLLVERVRAVGAAWADPAAWEGSIQGTAQAALAIVSETAEMGRQMGVYGAEVPVPSEATAFDRALGLAGRDPSWRS